MRLIAFAAAAFVAFSVHAQYPDKPVRLVVPFPPGGAAELGARIYSVPLGQALGQPVVIDTRPGADGAIAADAVMKAAPDGYTLFYATNTAFNWVLATRRNPPYNPMTDFTPVSLIGYFGFFLFSHPSVPATNVAELIAYAKANPGKLNFGSAGNGTSHHLVGELFKLRTGTDLVHVPYKGAGPMMQDLLGGNVDMAFDGMATSAPQIKGGKLRPLAVSTQERSPSLPDVPTLRELGVADFEVTTWYALWAVKGTPKEIVDRMYQEVAKVLQQPDIKNIWELQGAVAGGEPPAHLARLVRSEVERWGKVVKAANIKIDN